MAEELDAIDTYEKIKKLKKENFKMLMKKSQIVLTQKKTNMIINFNDCESASIKSFAVKK